MSLGKRILITLALLASPFVLGLLITYQVIKVDWISMMEIQPSFRPMEAPLPLPDASVPLGEVAYTQEMGEPVNPVPADEFSLQRGETLYGLNCALCHGPEGAGDGSVAGSLRRKPADLLGQNARNDGDGTIFVVVGYGVPGTMPPLRENLTQRDRWDVVNYVRFLQEEH